MKDMVSVPRWMLEKWQVTALEFKIDSIGVEIMHVLAQSVQQHQGEPVALPERLPMRSPEDRNLPKGHAGGWNACLDEIAKLGEVERLHERVTELEAHCKRLGRGDAERYWEDRWRDTETKLAEQDALLSKALADIEFIQKECGGDVSPGYIGCLVDDLHDLLSASAERNQCDGCQAGIPLVNGTHRMGKPGGYPDAMSCQASKYAEPSAPVERDERAVGACKIGIYGKAYDQRGDHRAYTYEHQPHNVEALKLGRAAASVKPGGDLIDGGLSLLKCLEAEGFGVFDRAALERKPYLTGVHILGGIAVKRCSSCWVTRPLADFHDDCTKPDGMRSNCRHCGAHRHV